MLDGWRLDDGRFAGAGRLFEEVDESLFEVGRASRPHKRLRRVGRQHAPGIHQGNPVATRRLVHEVGRHEDRHTLVARQVDQQLPEGIARQRIHARSRLIEDEKIGPVHDGDGERQALADAERQVRSQLIDVVAEAKALEEFIDAPPALRRRQVEEPRVQVEVLPNRQFGIEREALRHVADAFTRGHVPGVDRTAEQRRRTFAGRQQAGQHLHGRGLAAAIGAHEAKDLATLDVEAHMVDRGEVAEPAGEVARHDHRLMVELGAWRDLQARVTRFQFIRQERDEGVLDGRSARFGLQFPGGAVSQHLAGVHGHQPIETLGLFHIGRGHDDAHARTAQPHALDELPELAARQRIDARRRFVENQEIGVVDQRAAQAELLAHAAGELLGQPVGEGREAGALQQLGDPEVALGAALAEQAAEELDILAHAEVRIEVLAQALRHEGDPRADRRAMAHIDHVAAQHFDPAFLDALGAGNEAQQRGFADAIRADQPDSAIGRNVERQPVERGDLPIAVRDALESDDRVAATSHDQRCPCRRSGHSTLESNLT